MSWAERMSKPCPKCKTVNHPDDGYVDVEDVLTIGFLCEFCGHQYHTYIQLNNIRVDPLAGMSEKGQANDGGRIGLGI